MKLADVSVRRPVFAVMMSLALLVLGWFSYRQLGLDLMPKTDYPTVTVSAGLPGASAEEMETSVTKVIESAVNTINGIDELRCSSSQGSARCTISFSLERDIEAATQDVRDKVAGVQGQFPRDTDPPRITKIDPDSSPILTLIISAPRSRKEVSLIADRQIKQVLETVQDVGEVGFQGDRRREIQILLNPNRLNAYGLTTDQVKYGRRPPEHRGARRQLHGRADRHLDADDGPAPQRAGLQQDRPGLPGGLRRPPRGRGARDRRHRGDPERDDARRRVGRVAHHPQAVGHEHGDGRRPGDGAARALVQAGLPSDIKVKAIRDQSRFIRKSFDEIQHHLILGGLLASLVVFLFIRNLRVTFIAALAIPISIVGTFTVMRALDFTLNNMTMLALSLATGIVIDDAIVVLENIFRYVEEKGASPKEAAIKATGEIGLAVMATTLSLVVIFLPVAFMTGQVGRYFYSFGITSATAILLSMFVSFTLTPALCGWFLRSVGCAAGARAAVEAAGRVRVGGPPVRALLEWSMAHRRTMMAVAGGRRGVDGAALPLRRQGTGARRRPERVQRERAAAAGDELPAEPRIRQADRAGNPPGAGRHVRRR